MGQDFYLVGDVIPKRLLVFKSAQEKQQSLSSDQVNLKLYNLIVSGKNALQILYLVH